MTGYVRIIYYLKKNGYKDIFFFQEGEFFEGKKIGFLRDINIQENSMFIGYMGDSNAKGKGVFLRNHKLIS